MTPTRRRTLVMLGVVLTVLLLGATVTSQFLPGSKSETDAPGEQRDPAVDANAPVLIGTSQGASEQDAGADAMDASRSDPSASDTAAEPETLSGRIVVRDPSGRVHEHTAGEFNIQVRHRGGITKRFASVERGTWSVRAPKALGVIISSLKLGGRMACVTWDEIPMPVQGPLVVQAWWPRPSVLQVSDRESGRPLLDVTLVQAAHFDDTRTHPSEGWQDKTIGTGLASPLTLPDRDGTPTWFVRAPGYAWGHVSVDHRSGGTHAVALERGGDLEVLFMGALPPEDAWLTVTSMEGAKRGPRAAEFRIDRHEPLSVAGLPPGGYRVEASQGRRRGVTLGSAQVEVRLGTSSTTTLELAPALSVPRVPLAGIIRTRGGVGPLPLSLVLSNRDAALPPRWIRLEPDFIQADPKRPGVFRWHAGKVAPGTWRATVKPLAVLTHLTVGLEGLGDAVIDVPEICRLHVKLSEADTDATPQVEDVDFIRGPRGSGTRGALTWDPSTGVWTGHVPVGPVRLEVMGRQHRELEKELMLHAGQNHHTLVLERAEGVRLQFRAGASVVPIDDITYVALIDEDGEDHVEVLYDRGRQVLHLFAPVPGRYRLRIRLRAGFKVVPEREIQFARGQQSDLTIPLVRKR